MSPKLWFGIKAGGTQLPDNTLVSATTASIHRGQLFSCHPLKFTTMNMCHVSTYTVIAILAITLVAILILLFQSELSGSEDAPRDRSGLGKDREHGQHVPRRGRGWGVQPGAGAGGGQEAGGGGQRQAQLPRHLQDPGTHRPCTSREKGGLRI